MKTVIAVLALVLSLAAESAPDARIQYFSNVRQVRIAAPDRQNYFAVDEAVWKHARPDLGDLRLYAADREVPYALTIQRDIKASRQFETRLLNVGRVNGNTEFVLDVADHSEYNGVTLRLAAGARDFVVRARAVGLEDVHQRRGVNLGTSTVFDFSREKLGSNLSLRLLRPANFRFLRITLPEIAPEHVLGATVDDTREQSSEWMPIPISPRIEQIGRTTVVSWDSAEQIPLARVVFLIDPAQTNFRRTVEVQRADGRFIASCEISRIHLVRDGKPVDSDHLALEFADTRAAGIRAVIHNGDDAALLISEVKAFALERRIYFDPVNAPKLELYSGDPKLSAPVYDYSKLFRADESAAVATLGPVFRNAAYTARPDERPWTERHPALLWGALVLAVAVLGAMALKGMKSSG